MSSLITVVLGMSNMPVAQKIKYGRQVTEAMSNHPSVFTNPLPSLSVVNSAINDLEIAMQDASDGGKSKTALMHDKERIMYKLMKRLARYVEIVADGDESVVHLATLSIKTPSLRNKVTDFELYLPDDLGAVGLRCKARPKTLYRWEYCLGPVGSNPWQVGNLTDNSNSFIGNLTSGSTYWFRVILMSKTGESTLGPKATIPL